MLLYSMAQIPHRDWQVSMVGRMDKVNMSHGSYSSTFTLEVRLLGFVLGIIMRSWHQTRSKEDYQNHWTRCRFFELHSYIADWWTWAFKVIFSLGIMVDLETHLCRKGLIEHLPRLSGRKSFYQLVWSTFNHLILTMCQSLSPHMIQTSRIGEEKYQNDLKKSGPPNRIVRE